MAHIPRVINFYLCQLGLLGLLLFPGTTESNAAEVETLESIRSSAEKYALAQIETFSTGSMNNTSRMTVGVRCTGQSPWTLYVPVSISALVDVVFSNRALTRGALLTAGDIQVQQVPMSKLPIGYISDPGQISNFELTRPVNAGAAITLSAVRARDMVQQGQEVIIRAQLAGLQVKMAGEALKNGKFGDLIPVKNLRSGRTVEATIVDESTVRVNL